VHEPECQLLNNVSLVRQLSPASEGDEARDSRASPYAAEFIDNGGQVWLCGACTKPRGITDDQLVKGSTIVGAATVVEEVVTGAKTVAFA
jgi:predicted peroxiredoxin